MENAISVTTLPSMMRADERQNVSRGRERNVSIERFIILLGPYLVKNQRGKTGGPSKQLMEIKGEGKLAALFCG